MELHPIGDLEEVFQGVNKMKSKFISILILCIFILLISHTERISAPELFGDGNALWLQTTHFRVGVIMSSWDRHAIMFAAVEHDGQGYMAQLPYPTIGQYGPYDRSGPWMIYYERKIPAGWVGRIEFRGHLRPFCGGENVSERCMWK